MSKLDWRNRTTISDATGTARLTLWQDNIGKIEVDKVDNSCELKDLIVNSYSGTKYLAPPKSGFTITPLDDKGAVEESDDESVKNELTDAEVAAVMHYTSGKVCISCKGKIEP